METQAPSAPSTSSLIESSGVSDQAPGDGLKLLERLRQKNREPETVKYLETLFERSKAGRWRFESQWYVNLSYYFGRQWITWLNGNAPDLARLHEPQAPPWRVRLTVNRIKPAIRREMSKVMKEKPTAYVIPSSSEDGDIAAAKAGENIFEHTWRTLKMPRELWVCQFWRSITGTGFIKDWWDPRAEYDGGVGQIQVEVPTPFHLYFSNYDQPDIDKQEYIIHVGMKSPEQVKALYQVEVTPDAVDGGGGVLESRLFQALNIDPTRVSQVAVKEIWIKPNSRYPAGAMFVWANGKLLYTATDPNTGAPVWPLYKKSYPFTKFDGVPTGRFYGDSSIIDLLSLQKEYNRTRSQIIEAKNQMAKPQLVAAKGSVNANQITSEPGLVIFYTLGYPEPKPLTLTPLPSYVLQELDRTLLDMADISGQHEVSSGTVPSGVTAASALSFLQEQDDTMLAPIIASLEAGVERLGQHFLCHVHERWTEPHAVKILGADNTWEIKEFLGRDLKGNTDLNIQAGSAMPRSIAAKQALILELAKMQLIAPDVALRHLEMASTGQIYEELQVDRRQAERENMRMSDPSLLAPDFSGMRQALEMSINSGGGMGQDVGVDGASIPAEPGGPGVSQPDMSMLPAPPDSFGGLGSGAPALSPETSPAGHIMAPPGASMDPSVPLPPGMPPVPAPPLVPVNTFDNHEIHIQVHNDYRKRQEFEGLDPKLKDEFERHVELHRAALGLPPSINPEQAQQIMIQQQALGLPTGQESPMGEGAPSEEAPPEGAESSGGQAPL